MHQFLSDLWKHYTDLGLELGFYHLLTVLSPKLPCLNSSFMFLAATPLYTTFLSAETPPPTPCLLSVSDSYHPLGLYSRGNGCTNSPSCSSMLFGMSGKLCLGFSYGTFHFSTFD